MEEKEIQDQLTSIRSLMERSSKFISLSGLSGVLAGLYALVGAGIAYQIIYVQQHTFSSGYVGNGGLVNNLAIPGAAQIMLTALVVLVASVATGIVLTIRKARRKKQQITGSLSRQLLFNMAVPLLAGGILILVLIAKDYFGLVVPASLIFYGLALVNAGNFSFTDVKYLGIGEILLGLLAALLPSYGLLLWAFGFGVLHIIYGSIMYFKYDK
ncbi:hypothetical protein [Mucilaginibacter sp.]|uniref:hypothetical protein n=1 Tax=Mucilaginibacter sp. TaxID=1882438 RepID=UPI0035BC14DF